MNNMMQLHLKMIWRFWSLSTKSPLRTGIASTQSGFRAPVTLGNILLVMNPKIFLQELRTF